MTNVAFEGKSLGLNQDETVLDHLLRHGHDIPYGCRAGVCQSCILVAEEGDIPSNAQTGLNDAQRQLGHFLSCQCRPSTTIKVRRADSINNQVDGTIVDKYWLNDSVICLKIKAPLDYTPGQYVTLWRDKKVARCYSLASQPMLDDTLEFHIKHIPNGVFSDWLARKAQPGQTITMQGPLGQCIFAADPEQPLLLTATGTGLAPILGILKDAIHQKHRGRIELLIGARSLQDFYLQETLLQLMQKNQNLNVTFVSLQKDSTWAIKGDIYHYANETFRELAAWRIFLCGSQSFVKKMKRQCFMNGAAMSKITADVFLPFAS